MTSPLPDMEVTEESSASDVFRVIFSAMATSQPWKSLLMHAVALRNPLFAELAGCCVSLHMRNVPLQTLSVQFQLHTLSVQFQLNTLSVLF